MLFFWAGIYISREGRLLAVSAGLRLHCCQLLIILLAGGVFDLETSSSPSSSFWGCDVELLLFFYPLWVKKWEEKVRHLVLLLFLHLGEVTSYNQILPIDVQQVRHDGGSAEHHRGGASARSRYTNDRGFH